MTTEGGQYEAKNNTWGTLGFRYIFSTFEHILPKAQAEKPCPLNWMVTIILSWHIKTGHCQE
jgi:hypothetical protein